MLRIAMIADRSNRLRINELGSMTSEGCLPRCCRRTCTIKTDPFFRAPQVAKLGGQPRRHVRRVRGAAGGDPVMSARKGGDSLIDCSQRTRNHLARVQHGGCQHDHSRARKASAQAVARKSSRQGVEGHDGSPCSPVRTTFLLRWRVGIWY